MTPVRRAMTWSPPLASAVLAAGIVAHQIIAVGTDVPVDLVRLRLGMVVLAAGAGFTFDDPAEATTASTPVPLSQRRTVRAGLALAAWACSWVVLLTVAGAAAGPLPLVPLTLEALGWLGAALAVAAVADGTATVPALLVAYVIVHRLPSRFALLANPGGPDWGPVRDRWLGVVAGAMVVVAVSSRDPARRFGGHRRPAVG